MIKFFRKIRQNLLMENKTSKYFKYAIGEIVLVVFGILIALQLSNWNELQNRCHKEIVNLKALKSELQNDLTTEFIDGNKSYLEKEKTLNKLTAFYNNKNDIPKDSLPYYYLKSISEWTFALNVAAFENLKSTGIDLITNDSLRLKISSLYSNSYPEILVRSKRLLEFSESEYKPIIFDNVNLKDTTLSQNDFESLKNNKQISNRIFYLSSIRKGMLNELNIIIPQIVSLIKDIDNELKLLEK